MAPKVSVQIVPSRRLAAVRRSVRIREVGSVWKPALDLVWAFLRAHPEVGNDGQNVFLYHHPASRADPMAVDFGVGVLDPFEPIGEVRPVETPAGEAAVAVHVGSYSRINEAHDAIHAWAPANKREFAGQSMEIYGHWTENESKLETTIVYFLR
jgi:DNA gyrase inhibitor GyrI